MGGGGTGNLVGTSAGAFTGGARGVTGGVTGDLAESTSRTVAVGTLGIGINLKRQIPALPVSIPDLPVPSAFSATSIIQEILSALKVLLTKALGGADLPLPVALPKRQIPGVPALPTSLRNLLLLSVPSTTGIMQDILLQFEALLTKLLGGAGLPSLHVYLPKR